MNAISHRTFPAARLRRLRRAEWSRTLAAEHRLHASDFVWPVFLQEGEGASTSPVQAMPGVVRYTVEALLAELPEIVRLGIPAIALFPQTPQELKNEQGNESLNAQNLVCRAVRAIKAQFPQLGVICDVALDPYTSHGHDGVLDAAGHVANDATVALLAQQAVLLAEAGADCVAPSDMMDGRIGVIRNALEQAGYHDTLILSYAAKYASAFYGPFREAVGSLGALKGASKKTYQMDSANRTEALHEVAMDVAEGADMLMVKPGLAYLDIVREVKDAFTMPTLAYQVSGEYAMIEAAAQHGWINRDAVMMESLLAFKRAGADAIFTYFARDAARLLKAS